MQLPPWRAYNLTSKPPIFGFLQCKNVLACPQGLGLLICSPQALKQSEAIGEKSHYNSLGFMTEMMAKWQTSCTPNVLGIYLLMRVLEKSKPIEEIHAEVLQRYERWVDFFSTATQLKLLVIKEDVRSYTVVPVTSTPDLLSEIKTKAKEKGILLGEGYGEWKPSSFVLLIFRPLKTTKFKF